MPVAAGRPTLGRGRGRSGGSGGGRGRGNDSADAPKDTEFNAKASTDFLASTFTAACEEAKEESGGASFYSSKAGGPAAPTSAGDFEAMMLKALGDAPAVAPAHT